MKVLMILPPEWPPFQPYLSTPSLTAALKKEGVEVIQRDLNTEAWDYLLTKDQLEKAAQHVKARYKGLKGGSKYDAIVSLLVTSQSIIDGIETAKKILRTEEFYNLEKYSQAQHQIQLARLLISGAYNLPELVFRLSDHEDKRYPPSSTRELIRLTRDEQDNTYFHFFKQYAIPTILAQKPDVVGISANDRSHVIPALTLARLIKESRPDTHIVVGGNTFTRWADVLVKNHQLFTYFDSVVIYEGETALVELVRRLSNKKSLAGVPNLIYYDGSKIVAPDRITVEDMNSLPTPDFDGLPLDLYLTPEPVLPILSSRGCYWGKCAFCDHRYGYPEGYRPRKVDLVIKDIITLQKKYNARLFFFVDEIMSPKMCDELSSGILKNNLKMNWVAQARLERGFTRQLLGKMASSGCKAFYWGLESGCQRVLDLINKGTDLGDARRILADSSRAGIWNLVFTFFGFPGETEAEAQQTIDFILENKSWVNSTGAGSFRLGKHSPVAKLPERYGVLIKREEKKDLLLIWDYQPVSGINSKKARLYGKELARKLREIFPGLASKRVHREHILVYLSRFDKEEFLRMAEPLRKQAVVSYTATEKARV